MKIGWNGPTWLLRDLLQEKSEISPKVNDNKPLPDRLVAQVRDSLDKSTVILRWEGRDFRCHVDTPVKKGEHLLLQLKEWSGNKQLFKVLERSFDPLFLEGDRAPITSHLLHHGYKEIPLPLLLRIQKYISEQEDDAYSSHEKTENNETVSFEYIIETDTLGVVIIKIEKQRQYYTGRLMVENKKTGKLLEKELFELQQYITAILEEKNVRLQLLRWEVIPTWDLQKIQGDLRKLSFIIDRKV